jgi:hypothetical protein
MNLLINLYLFILIHNEKNNKNTEFNVELNKKIPNYTIQNKKGYDLRFDTVEEVNNSVLDSIRKYEIMMKLQSENISIFEKTSIVEELYKENKYVPNILNGGLLDGWNDVF